MISARAPGYQTTFRDRPALFGPVTGGVQVNPADSSLSARVTSIVATAGGALYNPLDMSSLFQDAAATVPVTASGQSVRRMNDLSGNGFHAIAPSDAARPVLTIDSGLSYLTADGVDDMMPVTALASLGETWWHVGGWAKDSALAQRAFATSNASPVPRGALQGGPASWVWRNAADTANSALAVPPAMATPHQLTVQQTSTALIAGRVNKTVGSSFAPFNDSAAGQGLTLFSGLLLTYSTGLLGRFYGGAFAPGLLSASDRDTMEQFVLALAGLAS